MSLVTSILDNPAYAGVWLTVGKLEAAVDPELWIEARKHLVDEIDPIEVSVVRKFGSTPPDVESRADATSG